MFGILFLLFTVVPAIELYLLFEIGARIGGFETLLLVILTGIVGAQLARVEGFSVIAKIQSELAKGELPADSIFQGLLIFGGGMLLITPGVLTDLLGLSMVFPLSRIFYVKILKAYIAKGMASGSIHIFRSTSMRAKQNDFTHEGHYRKVDENTFEAEYTKKD